MTKIKQIYWDIWQQRNHVCEVCGYPVYEPRAHVFSHVYSKGARPDLKYDKRNIEIWCSSVIRNDGKRGCHELHHTNPEKFKERAEKHGWQKPNL